MQKLLFPRFDARLQQFIDEADGETKEQLLQAQKRIAEADALTERLIREGKLPPIRGRLGCLDSSQMGLRRR